MSTGAEWQGLGEDDTLKYESFQNWYDRSQEWQRSARQSFFKKLEMAELMQKKEEIKKEEIILTLKKYKF